MNKNKDYEYIMRIYTENTQKYDNILGAEERSPMGVSQRNIFFNQ